MLKGVTILEEEIKKVPTGRNYGFRARNKKWKKNKHKQQRKNFTVRLTKTKRIPLSSSFSPQVSTEDSDATFLNQKWSLFHSRTGIQ